MSQRRGCRHGDRVLPRPLPPRNFNRAAASSAAPFGCDVSLCCLVLNSAVFALTFGPGGARGGCRGNELQLWGFARQRKHCGSLLFCAICKLSCDSRCLACRPITLKIVLYCSVAF